MNLYPGVWMRLCLMNIILGENDINLIIYNIIYTIVFKRKEGDAMIFNRVNINLIYILK